MSFQEAKRRLILLFMDDLKLHIRNEKGVDSIVQKICVCSEDIGMESGIERSAMSVIEKVKIVKSDGKAITSLREGESFKYLGILEIDFWKRR